MNSHALLAAQGWRGKGHSLHKTDDSIGLAKPLLLSRKDDRKGLGTKQHFTSDQWWLDAFDEQLKGLDTSKEGEVLQTVTTGKLNSIEKGSLGKYYLYNSFVRGGFLKGTMGSQEEKQSSDSDGGQTAKSDESQPKETKEERKARKEAKRRRKEERAKDRAARREPKSKAGRPGPREDADAEKRRRRARKEEKRRRKDKEAADKSGD